MRRNRVITIFAVVFAVCTAVLWLGNVFAAATVVTNDGLTVSEADSGTITETLLLTEDAEAPGAIITYTLVTTPANGSLILSGTTTLTPTSSFHQSNIDDSALVYMHNDSETLSDTFDFTVTSGTEFTLGTFVITVTPVFDQIPVVSSQTFTTDENSTVGEAVGAIVATDSDAGDSLTYTILNGNEGTAFEVDSSDGGITVANQVPLDFETNQSITFTVEVEDMGMLKDTAVITVNINDINEAPIITGTTYTLPENSSHGTFLGNITASDVDAGDTLTYTITAGNPSSAFDIDISSGEITVDNENALDYETTETFNLTVEVEDSGGETDTATVTVNLEDVNEPPTANNASFSINENSSDTTFVGTISATDPEDGTLTYTITGGNTGSAFAVGTNSGTITVNNSGQLDFEITPVFTVTLNVADDEANTVPVTATINLLDQNESPFVNDATFSINENSGNGTAVGTATASDQDNDDIDNLSFTILSGNQNGAFAIANDGSNNAAITVLNTNALDYETTPTFTLGIIVTDTGGLDNTATITINLNNLFDEDPTVNNATFTVAEGSNNGVVVGTVTATDPELVSGDALTFSIIGNNTGSVFAINSSSGQITVPDASKLDADAIPTFNLTVQGIDKGGNIDTATITINVTPLPITNIFLPAILNNYPPIEPNNSCSQSYAIGTGTDYVFTADDTEDWYRITLAAPSNLTIILSSFEPAQGQLIAYSGNCNNLTLLGNNGNPNTTDKTLSLGVRPAGTYYIRVFSSPITNTTYTLRVNVN